MPKLFWSIVLWAGLTLPAFAQAERWAHESWRTDFSSSTVPFAEIVDVIPRDAIPSIDAPEFLPAGASAIPGNEPVVAFELNGDARAYPLRILMWHEIVNDVVGGRPVAVTYCPLCNTSVVFDRRLDGEAVTFGTTGKLRHSDLIMYDRGGHSWWQQFNGEAIVGARAGGKLDALPSALISLDMFRARWPEGRILVADPRRAGNSGANPYVRYDSTPIPFLFRGELPTDIEPMMRVALVQEPEAVAVTLPYLREHAPFRLGDLEFHWQAGQSSALDAARIADGRDVGTIEVFRRGPDGGLEPVVYTVTFAFAARAFLPGLAIIQ